MSSFANLFGKSTKVDENIEQLFKNTRDGPVTAPKQQTNENESTLNQSANESDEEEEEYNDESNEGDDSDDAEQTEPTSKNDDENENLEAQYFDKLLSEQNEEQDESKESSEAKSSKVAEERTKAKVATTVDLKEKELEKADRTVFVGNVPADVITSKIIAKNFKNLFKHYGKIDSIRYRSISFDEHLPRKVAFAKKNLHKSRDSVNAYIVYKEKPASIAAKELNATVFEDHHLRVDHVSHPAPKDNKRTIFVGNLDFEEKEETLWKYFNSKLDQDVESVRIIRDSKTNLGKGFALVQFKDTLSVNKALLLNDKPLETGTQKKGRKLRISRAKSNAKPSLMSPNHFDNQKKKFAAGKADRSTVGKAKRIILEGQRATKGEAIKGIKGSKKGKKVKKPRIRERSTKFKEERKTMNKV
ncbi:RNA recognition motif family protein [Candida albicans]|uniref:Nucleolar protein 12 n=1 Tax=Candida albicans TaxID=5476 RepID=A0A8H6BXN8_CANAX|nr:RNA recognition motif family protein [Candida albicans]